jgi:choline dehydrogenase-like flavoprotein
VFARIFILATGGIENARILLLSTDIQEAANAYDLVGRYFMAHLELKNVGVFLPSPTVSMQYFRDNNSDAKRVDVGKCRKKSINWDGATDAVLTISEKLRHEHKLVNFTVALEEFTPTMPPAPPRGSSLSKLSSRSPDSLLFHLSRVLADSDDREAGIAKEASWQGKQLVAYRLTNTSETTPNPNSRVTLARETDQFNCNRVALNWTLSDIDLESLQRGYRIIGQEVGRAGLGRLRSSVPTRFEGSTSKKRTVFWSQHHHMGTTRMHADPKKGVVDANCKVHGTSNLFIAGSSVFPTSGCATPTLTIIALAMRLADHVKGKLL